MIKPPVCHPANFIGDNWKVQGFGTFSPNHGYTVDSSLVFPFLGVSSGCHAPELHHFFMNNTFLGSKLMNIGMHLLKTNGLCISSL